MRGGLIRIWQDGEEGRIARGSARTALMSKSTTKAGDHDCAISIVHARRGGVLLNYSSEYYNVISVTVCMSSGRARNRDDLVHPRRAL